MSVLVCAGADLDHETGEQVGPACGRRFRGGAEQARAAGPPMCPACRRPDPQVARMLAVPAPVEQDALF